MYMIFTPFHLRRLTGKNRNKNVERDFTIKAIRNNSISFSVAMFTCYRLHRAFVFFSLVAAFRFAIETVEISDLSAKKA